MPSTTKLSQFRHVQNRGEEVTIDLTGLNLPNPNAAVVMWVAYKARRRGMVKVASEFPIKKGTVASLGNQQLFTPTRPGIYTPFYIVVGQNKKARQFRASPIHVR